MAKIIKSVEKEDKKEKSFLNILSEISGNTKIIEGTEDNSTKEWISTGNLLLDYQISAMGGIPCDRVTMFVGPHATGKSLFTYQIALNALLGKTSTKKKYDYIFAFESEGATSKNDLLNMGFTEDLLKRFIWFPFRNVEELKQQQIKLLEKKLEGKIKERFVITTDSIGLTSSKKEIVDTLDSKDTKDMSRAGSLASYFRMLPKAVQMSEVPTILINHTYKTQDLFAKTVVSGGEKATLAPRYIIELSKLKIKKGSTNEIVGNELVSHILKSLTAKEFTKVSIPLTFKEGLKWNVGLDKFLEKMMYKGDVENIEEVKKYLTNLFKKKSLLDNEELINTVDEED